MKRALAVFLAACTMVLSLSACAGGKSSWKDEDFTFTKGSETITVAYGQSFITYSSYSAHLSYDGNIWDTELEGEWTSNRGLKLGDTIDDFKKLYTVIKGYAVWELFNGDNNEYTSFQEYNNDSLSDMYASNNNVWLDLGFYKEDGQWKVMKDYELQNVWFCDANLSSYGECVVFSVNFDKWGQVVGLSIEHFNYDSNWVEWQNWA